MIEKINNQRGATSLTWVIVIFISTIIISGFIGIINKTLAINEIQGIMDMSGVIALRYGADDAILRSEERLHVDSGIAKKKFMDLIEENLASYVGPEKMLTSYKVESVSVLKDEQTALGLGGIQGREEYFLEAVITASYSVSSIVDGATISVVNYFDFLWTNERASVSIGDNMGDGEGNIVIRTVSRLALR